ncbi:hypothetical protein PpBr36_01055 [Pyricularia pennisetigena]|uniref:hypothetical protein n=1 Tax=Pyricularia pennisetigena TaxID=1578925 RepID=UPI0011542E3F|nr:hypothetical protein PpBr36_01055 [Pyricularia pennisetigena]TLS29786.1 hypothetical protein PpBr36_01055 [Pyricularia pennisetigena]
MHPFGKLLSTAGQHSQVHTGKLKSGAKRGELSKLNPIDTKLPQLRFKPPLVLPPFYLWSRARLALATSVLPAPKGPNNFLPPDQFRFKICGELPTNRNRRVVAVAASAAAVGMVIKLRADALKKNEMAQKNSAVPNFYVSVERSGGGI